MAITALLLKSSAERSMSVSFTSAADTDSLTFASLATLLPAGTSAIKTFLTTARGDVPLTLAAIGENGVVISDVSSVAGSGVPQVDADRSLAGFDAGSHVLRIALSSTISA